MASAYFKLKILKRRRAQTVRSKQKVNKDKNNSSAASFTKCRVCLREGYISIFSNEFKMELVDSIKLFGGIDIDADDEYPKHLCTDCNKLLQNAIYFRKKAMESDLLLRQSSVDTYSDSDWNANNVHAYDPDPSYEESKSFSKSYSCRTCSLNFESWDEYATHKNTKQHRNVRIQCPICNSLLTVQRYKTHLACHQSSHLICDVCGKLYRKDNLVRHLQLHNFDLPFQCQLCPYRGRFMGSLKIHMRTHTGDKPFSCDKCQLRFITRSNLNRHLLTHKKERPYKCIECSRGFYTKHDMDIHFKSDHAGIKDFGCRTCGNKYGTRKALMRHELRVHKRDKMSKGRIPLYLQNDLQ